MKTVYLVTLNDNTQASIVKDVLQNDGSEVFTKNEILSTVLNIPGFQIELEVDEKDYDRAMEILKSGFPYLVEK